MLNLNHYKCYTTVSEISVSLLSKTLGCSFHFQYSEVVKNNRLHITFKKNNAMKNKYIIQVCFLFLFLFSGRLIASNDKNHYLIITRNIFIDALQPLILNKESNGTIVKTVVLGDIVNAYEGRDIQEKIRNCIIDYYINYDIGYLLLVGAPDADDNPRTENFVNPTIIDKDWEIPIRYVYATPWQENYFYVPCEMYYSNLHGNWDDDLDGIYGERWEDNTDGIDEIDWIPDIALGRIPCRTVEQLEIYINKLLSIDYSNKWDSEIKCLSIYAKINQEIVDSIANEKIMANLPEYDLPTFNSLNYELNNNNYHILTFTGHANNRYLGLNNDDWDESGLLAGGSLFFAYIAACSTATIDDNNSYTTLAENLLFKEACGAIGYIGAWRLSTPLGQNDLWRHFFRNYYDGSETIIGNTFKKSLQSYYYSFSYWMNLSYDYWHYTALIYSFFGDPQLCLGNISKNGPEIVSIPNPIAWDLHEYQYDEDNIAEAIGDGNIVWSAVSVPEYFNISPDGVISWIPDMYGGEEGNGGRPTITIKATDKNGSTIQSWDVQCTWSTHKIISSPNKFGCLNQSYHYDENDKVETEYELEVPWKLMEGPLDFRLDPLSGVITWIPKTTGIYDIVLRANDLWNLTFQKFHINVLEPPEQPSQITGSSYACVDSLETYFINKIPGITYLWEATGGIITDSSEVAHVIWTKSGEQSLQVTANNGGCNSTPQKLFVYVNSAPSTPGEILGEINPIVNTNYYYEVAVLPNVDYYNWTVSGGDVEGTGNKVAILWNTIGTQTISVQAVNDCGTSLRKTININVRDAAVGIAGLPDSEIRLFPNPVTNKLSITNLGGKTIISIYTVNGQKIKEINVDTDKYDIDMLNFVTGFYIVKIKSRSGTVEQIVMKK